MEFPRIGFAKRLLALYGVIFIVVLLMTDWTLSHVLEKRDRQQLQDSLLRQSSLILEIALPLIENPSKLQSQVKKISEGKDLRITIVDPQGVVLADSDETSEKVSGMDNHATRPEIASALMGKTGVSIRYSMTVKTRMLYVALPVRDHEKILGVVRTAMPIVHVDEILASVRRPVMLTAILGILIVLVAGILFSKHLTKRIRRITSVAERYAREDWSEKILMDGTDELKMLADTMNQMAATLSSRIEDLESEKGKISVILSHMNEGVIAIDRRKQYVMANPAAETIFGFSSSMAHGKGLIEITRHPQIERLVDQAFQERQTASLEIQVSGKARKTLYVNVIVLESHIRDIGGILVFHDTTELRRLENIRKEFVANVSHELRTPLTSIKGFIETLLGGALKDPATSERFLKIVSEETDRLGRLVEDILTLGEIEQGAALVKKESIDLASDLPEILERFKSQLLEKKIAVENRISGGSLLLSGDRDKIHQVFINLIDNAIKFNKPEGKIVLSADQKPEGVTITIEDTGIGIPQEAQARIFERFFRVDKARSKEMGGTGLGLAIVKHIMEAHGGRATCQSTPGQGSRFSVFFPAPN
jgi:two-component system, OmpR family, phosphate regulon sensor histidine kinase PhoR